MTLNNSHYRKWDSSGGPEACWEWTGPRFLKSGYGRAYIGGGKSRGAHRVAYELANGPVPDGLDVLHACDNPPCGNPAHLWTGTARDNLRDARDKGRLIAIFRTGERATFHKLTWVAVRDIRARYQAGEHQRSIGRRHGVSGPTVSNIVTGKTWPEPDINLAVGKSA